jgi:hypothetical protein
MLKLSFFIDKTIVRGFDSDCIADIHLIDQLSSERIPFISSDAYRAFVGHVEGAFVFEEVMEKSGILIFLGKVGEKAHLFAVAVEIDGPAYFVVFLIDAKEVFPEHMAFQTAVRDDGFPASVDVVAEHVGP